MKIGIDIDEVLTSPMPAIISFHNKKYGTKLKRKDFYSYNFWEIWGGTREEAVRKINKLFVDTDLIEKLIPFEGVLNHLLRLRERNHKLHIITGRRDDMIERTERWIAKHFPDIFSGVHFTNAYCLSGKSITKSSVCKKTGVEVMVEDDIKHATDCVNNGIKVFLMDCPWNQSFQLENVERVFSWNEIMKKFK